MNKDLVSNKQFQKWISDNKESLFGDFDSGWNSALEDVLKILRFKLECATNKYSWIQNKSVAMVLENEIKKIEELKKQ